MQQSAALGLRVWNSGLGLYGLYELEAGGGRVGFRVTVGNLTLTNIILRST